MDKKMKALYAFKQIIDYNKSKKIKKSSNYNEENKSEEKVT